MENCPFGVVRGITGHTGVPPRSSSGGWTLLQVPCNPCGVSHSSSSISPSSGEAPSMNSHPSARVLSCGA